MGAHVSDCPNHTVGRVTPFETRGQVALAGQITTAAAYVKGLLADGLYKIEGQEGVFHGDTLMRAGINAPGTWGDYQSRLIHIITADK